MEMCVLQDSAYSYEGHDNIQLMQNRICDYLAENPVLGRITIIIYIYDEHHAARQHILDMNSRIYELEGVSLSCLCSSSDSTD